MNRQITAAQIAAFLKRPLIGEDLPIESFSSLAKPAPNSLLFAKEFREPWVDQLNQRKDVLVIATLDYEGKLTVPHICSANPRLDYARALQEYFAPSEPHTIADTARISPGARLGTNVHVGHFCVIEDDVEIGDHTVIMDHVVIRRDTRIGEHCIIRAHTLIGVPGLGFEYDEDGLPVLIPQVGGVRIGNHVEVGALNTIDRGTLDHTVLHDYVKLCAQVIVAHNVTIGENAFIAPNAELSGSVTVGRNLWMGPNSCISDGRTLGDNVLVGIGATVIHSHGSNVVLAGNPARVLRENPSR